MLGSLLKQVINGVGKVPEEVWRALVLRGREKIVSGRGPQLSGTLYSEDVASNHVLTTDLYDYRRPG